MGEVVFVISILTRLCNTRVMDIMEDTYQLFSEKEAKKSYAICLSVVVEQQLLSVHYF